LKFCNEEDIDYIKERGLRTEFKEEDKDDDEEDKDEEGEKTQEELLKKIIKLESEDIAYLFDIFNEDQNPNYDSKINKCLQELTNYPSAACKIFDLIVFLTYTPKAFEPENIKKSPIL